MRTLGENTDLVLFDYLEGNFSEDQMTQIEKEINADPLMAEELEIWQSSRIESGFYDTAELENDLIRETVLSFNFSFYLNSLLIMGIAVFTGTNSKTIPLTLAAATHVLPKAEAIPPQVVFQQVDSTPEILIFPHQKVTASFAEYETSFTQTTALNIPRIMQPKLEPVESANHLISVEPTEMAISPASTATAKEIKKIDRKSMKAKNRMQRKAKQNRMASEFMKGDIPYVVPIDTQNF